MAKPWRLAKGLETLRAQVNASYPGRSKSSDGSIGNAEHSARESDHNPDTDGVVKAIDITHDPAHGFDSYAFAEMLRQQHDPRIKYLISNRRICAGPAGPSPWTWRKYSGANPHDHHCHISIRKEGKFFDDTREWNLAGAPEKWTPSVAHTAENYTPPPRTLRRGTSGADVKTLQQLLSLTGKAVDGKFGKATLGLVVAAQKKAKLHPDGIVGPQTWTALRDK